MLPSGSPGLHHSISVAQPTRLKIASPGGVPLNDRHVQADYDDISDNLFRCTNIPNSNLSIPFVLLLVAGLGFGIIES